VSGAGEVTIGTLTVPLGRGASWRDLAVTLAAGTGPEGSADAVRVTFAEADGGLLLTIRYPADAHDTEQIDRFAGYHLRALELIATDPTAPCRTADLLSAAEEALLRGFAGPAAPLPAGTFVDRFDSRVAAHPDRVALRCGSVRLSYVELDRESELLAAALRDAGVARGDVVTTLLPRDRPWAVTVLALFKLGAVYLPQDLDYPIRRVATVLRRSGCRHVVATATDAPRLRAAFAEVTVHGYGELTTGDRPATPVARPAATDPAYIVFTSGSTGEPKGATITHSGMLNHLLAKHEDLALDADDRVAQIATQCFDISVWQLLNAWLCGGTTFVYGRYDILDVPGFLRAVATDGVTVLEVVPSYLDLLLREADRRPVPLPALRFLLVTGEALPPNLTGRWFTAYPGVPMVNAYGPTEASDDVTHHVLRAPVEGVRVPVGRPVRNTGIHVVGPDGALRPLGSFGEIWVTGAGVGLGYVNDPERTAAVFRPNTLDDRSARAYRTGDIGRWLPGGVLDCAGREDDQVKVRGYRIELSDIDNALAGLPGVLRAVTVVDAVGAQPRLVSYYVGAARPELAAFARALAGVLPGYMHPEKVVRLDALPLSANGKVDRQALSRREGPAAG
jgi:amino acid adenylation domain-containing protein